MNFNGGKTTLSGQAEPGDTVSVAVTLNNGTPTTKLATVLSDGSWTLQLTGLKNGEFRFGTCNGDGRGGQYCVERDLFVHGRHGGAKGSNRLGRQFDLERLGERE